MCNSFSQSHVKQLIYGIMLIGCLINWPTPSEACSCIYSHPQEHFCSADFVATITVRGDVKYSSTTHYQSYPIKVHKIFKGTDKSVIRKGFLFTGSPFSSCAVNLKKNILYLVTGRLVNGKPYVNECNFIGEWSNLSGRQRKGFRRNYGRSCGCKVRDYNSYTFYSSISPSSPDNRTSTDSGISSVSRVYRKYGNCQWETKWEIEFDCQGSFSACVSVAPPSSEEFNDVPGSRRRSRSKLGKCQWEQNQEYLDCMRRKSERKAASQIEREGEP